MEFGCVACGMMAMVVAINPDNKVMLIRIKAFRRAKTPERFRFVEAVNLVFPTPCRIDFPQRKIAHCSGCMVQLKDVFGLVLKNYGRIRVFPVSFLGQDAIIQDGRACC